MTLYAAKGRLIPFNSNSPTGSTFTEFSTFINTRGLVATKRPKRVVGVGRIGESLPVFATVAFPQLSPQKSRHRAKKQHNSDKNQFRL